MMRDTGRMRTPRRTSIRTPGGRKYSKYIHGMLGAISARDHTILPRHGDKIRYFSYSHVFSFIFSFWGVGEEEEEEFGLGQD